MADPHKRTDERFDRLSADAESHDTRLLLEALHEVATLLIELEIGQQEMLDNWPEQGDPDQTPDEE